MGRKMKRDILGKRELESVQLNWSVAAPGLMTTRCCGTGTCDNHPDPSPRPHGINSISKNYHIACSKKAEKASKITMTYGYLRP